MIRFRRWRLARAVAAAALAGLVEMAAVQAQQIDAATIVRHIDQAAQARYDSILGFTVIEHYAVYRGKDDTHPAAEMTVKTTYRRETGKSYAILSQSGSGILQKFVLAPLLNHEQEINVPGNVQNSWFTSANYEMKLKPGGIRNLDGRECIGLTMTPKRKAPNMIDGTLWVDAKDNSIVQIEGIASKSPSVFAGATQMMRRYIAMDGHAMAFHGRAESDSPVFGRTVVTIDYRDYQIQLSPVQ